MRDCPACGIRESVRELHIILRLENVTILKFMYQSLMVLLNIFAHIENKIRAKSGLFDKTA